ncbi:PWWP and LEDGF domain containing protein [Euroglyphus maynei]|uniref:PWWP and LEDGF domain containing protein n=1 Tax=Euroglyphus maynei TaxID=6958 RepID=A0A1Y3BJF5_EURMA|nr:PWWP and LEDGF domain containing protein [Euroglyphus maynei]
MSNKKLPITETIDDVMKLKQKLQDEKLAQKLEEKEREKERRKREKMERKRLERLQQAKNRNQEDTNRMINEMLTTIDSNIKLSLSKTNANIDKCLETMDSIDDVKMKITSKNVTNFGDNLKELISTLKKCRKYKQEERVRQKADHFLNKMKELFSSSESQVSILLKF